MDDLSNVRHSYAEEIRAESNIRSETLVAAFGKVPREHFLGPGPWLLQKRGSYKTTDDANPAHLYHDVAVAIDPIRGLNNGQPSFLAFCLDSLDLQDGDRVLHIGCGVGYYTAIMAEVVGSSGHVTGVEIDADLAHRARRNLNHLKHVEVVHADGVKYYSRPFDAIFINAGVTHPQTTWLDSLYLGGRLILFLTSVSDDTFAGKGRILKVRHEDRGYSAHFLSSVAVYHCFGSRDTEAGQLLHEALIRGGWQSVQSLRRDIHELNDTCWLHSSQFCLSILSVPSA